MTYFCFIIFSKTERYEFKKEYAHRREEELQDALEALTNYQIG